MVKKEKRKCRVEEWKIENGKKALRSKGSQVKEEKVSRDGEVC